MALWDKTRHLETMSTGRLLSPVLVLSLSLVVGCNPRTNNVPDGGAGDGGPSCGLPNGTPGVSTGRIMFPFTIPQCVEGDPLYSFYNEDYCSSEISVVTIAAGWCQPCREEARDLQALVNEAYAACGVRVMQVMVQDNNSNEPSLRFCQEWQEQYGLTNIMLRDQGNMINSLFPSGALPSTMVVSGAGLVTYRFDGSNTRLCTLRGAIEQALIDGGVDPATCRVGAGPARDPACT